VKSFDGKMIYMTGGSSGIGLEMGRIFAARGADLLLIARNEEKLHTAKEVMERFKLRPTQRIETLSMDVADLSEVQAKMKAAVAEYGAPDILISSAGINKYADRFENITYDMFDEVMKINLYGPRNVIQTLLPEIKKRRSHVVVLSSAAAFFGMFGYTAYGTSKAALLGLCDSLRYEFKPMGIPLTVVCPPEVDTPMNIDEAKTLPCEGRAVKNLSMMMMPEEAARVIVEAIEKKKYMFIPGGPTRFLWLLHRISNGWLTRMTSDTVIWMAQRKIKKK
jgi:NAD(P)-dependent dehydrogenase (short-subunit alcohol dehydrogenase family)